MNIDVIPDNIEKIERDQFMTFLDVTPNAETMDFKVLGIGVTDYGISYNPQVDQEKWIVERNARNDHKSNQKQGNVSQTIYKNDPCFEFVANGRDKLNYKTHILDVDLWNGNNGSYPAKLSDGLIAITQFMNEDAVVEYDLYYQGDPTEGTVTVDKDTGKVSFSANTNL